MASQHNLRSKLNAWHILTYRMRHVWVSILAACLVGIYAGIAMNFSFLNPVSQALKDFSVTDIYYQALADEPANNYAITVVDMTKMYTRHEVAEMLYDIMACNPKVVGVDLVFQDIRDDFEGNDMLVDIASTYDNIVFSFYRQDVYDNKETEVHSFFADSLNVTEGFTDMPRGLYGKMKRKVPLVGESYGKPAYSFSSAVANMYAEEEIVDLTPREAQSINFSPTTFAIVPGDSVMFHPELIQDRIVLIGGINRLEDMHDTPLGKLNGTVLLAYSIQTILDNNEVRNLPYFWLVIVTLIVVVVTRILQVQYQTVTKKIGNLFARNIIGSSYIMGLVISMWLACLLLLTFIIFCKADLNVNLGWAFAIVPFLTNADSIYQAIINAVETKVKERKRNKKQ